jgi:hypothetical protein
MPGGGRPSRRRPAAARAGWRAAAREGACCFPCASRANHSATAGGRKVIPVSALLSEQPLTHTQRNGYRRRGGVRDTAGALGSGGSTAGTDSCSMTTGDLCMFAGAFDTRITKPGRAGPPRPSRVACCSSSCSSAWTLRTTARPLSLVSRTRANAASLPQLMASRNAFRSARKNERTSGRSSHLRAMSGLMPASLPASMKLSGA